MTLPGLCSIIIVAVAAIIKEFEERRTGVAESKATVYKALRSAEHTLAVLRSEVEEVWGKEDKR